MSTSFGKYELERELGRGATGIVYLARDPQLQRQIALKRLVLPHTLQGQARLQVTDRFTREARAIAAIRHPAIPQVFEIGELNGQPFLAMEFCPGGTLREELTMRGPMPLNTAVAIIRQVLGALEAAHKAGIFHRDIKPDNIIFDSQTQTVKLTDFGIARLAAEQTMTAAGAMLGTPAYMAPEQILGKPIDARTDLFSVGILFCELRSEERRVGKEC